MRTFLTGFAVVVVGCVLRPVSAGDEATLEAARKLRTGAFAERLKALDVLEGQGQAPVVEKAVLQALDDAEWEVQIRAARALGVVGGEDARKALVLLALRGDVEAVRDAATDALRVLGAEAASASLLKTARASRVEAHRAHAVRAIGRLGSAVSVDTLGDFLRAREVGTVAAAAAALPAVVKDVDGAARALKELQPLLRFRDDRGEFATYAAAVAAVARLDLPAARAQAVREVLLQGDDDLYVPMRVVRGLREQRQDGVAASLLEALPGATTPVQQRRLARLCGDLGVQAARAALATWATSNQPTVRIDALRALGLLADPASQAALEQALDDKEPRAAVEAVTALGRCLPPEAFLLLAERVRKQAPPDARLQYVVEIADRGDPAGIGALRPFLEDPDWRVATAAVVTVGTLGIGDDLPILQPLVGKGDWRLRGAVYEALGRLRAPQAIPILARGLEEKDPLVRGVCLANLQILTRQRLEPRPRPWLEWWEARGGDLALVKRSRRTAAEKAKEAEERDSAFYAHDFERYRQRAVEVLQKARMLVTIGAWDHAERVLEQLRIPFTLLRSQELKESGLNPNQILLVNCEGTQDREGQDRIRWFVNVGGYLMTTDWALVNTLTPCFPGYLERFQAISTGNDVVTIEEAQPRHPWTRGVFEKVPALQWWLEIQAFPMTVAYPQRCEVLVDSVEMRTKYGTSPLAASFRAGLGKVQHSVSHFFLQEQGYAKQTQLLERRIFLADHLGVPLPVIRGLTAAGRLEGPPDGATLRELAPHYSMFRLIVNVVKEKADWVEDL